MKHTQIKFRPRETEKISVEISNDTLASIKNMAKSRHVSDQALLKLDIGKGLRQDISKLFGDRVLETTAEVLSR